MRKARYPDPDAIANTIRHPSTSLEGALRFYGQAGAAVYAYDRTGLGNVASRVWLPPGATRQLSTYLDMVMPGVGGLIMQPASVQPAQLAGVGPATACGRLREIAESKHQVAVGPHNTTLCSLIDSPDEAWDWSGLLAYDTSYRLKSGEYTTSRPMATFHVRAGVHPTRADVLIEIHQAEDLDRVRDWIAQLLPAAERWSILPFALLDDRHAEVRAVVKAIADGGAFAVANPNMQPTDDGQAADLAEFVKNLREARYATSIQGLDSLIERAEAVDHATLSAFDLYHWAGTSRRRVAVRVRIKQSGTDPLTIVWGAAREPFTAAGVAITQPVALDADGWAMLTPAAWDDDVRIAHLRRLWARVLDSLHAGASSAAA